jgi:hypothetical protein
MIGIETATAERIAMARELAQARRAQFRRARREAAPVAPERRTGLQAVRPRIRSASRA